MYSSALWLHSLLRWAVLVAGAIAWFRSIGGATGRRPWTPKDELWGFLFILSLDLQMVVGLVLYVFLSPITKMAFQNFGAAMKIDTTRFFAVEHITGMIVGIALAHVGRVMARKARTDERRHRLITIFFGLALVIIVASIPWPFLPAPFVSRPLFPR
jgi:cytochrome c oxidase assembly factor CtaG